MLNNIKSRFHFERRDVIGFLASLLLAFALWIVHNLSLSYSGTLSVPVIAESNIPGRFDVCESPVIITARCHTSGYAMLFRGRKPVKVVIDPSDFTYAEGDYYSISDNELSRYVTKIFGSEVSLESFLSQSYRFKFLPENNRKVPVAPVFDITFGEEYSQIGAPYIQPDSVIVYGEPRTVNAIDKVYTEQLALSGVSTPKHGTLKLIAPKGTRLSDTQIHYSIDVTRCVEIRRDFKVEVRNVPSDRRLMVFPSTAYVELLCAFPVDPDPTPAITLYIDYDDFANSLNGRCVARTDELPANVISITVDPQIFECFETPAE